MQKEYNKGYNKDAPPARQTSGILKEEQVSQYSELSVEGYSARSVED